MSKVQELLDTQKRIEESLASRMADFEKSMKTAGSSDSKLSLDKLSQDYKSFKDTVWAILQLLRSQIQALLLHTDDLETYNRRNALLFSGIEEKDSQDCRALIMEVINSTMNVTSIKATAIYSCHRLGNKSTARGRPILVRFADIATRDMIWMEKKRLKSSSTVLSEFLTKPRQAIFSSARKHFGIHSCWTRDGAVFIKLPNSERKRIATIEELEELMAKFPAAVAVKNSGIIAEESSRTGPMPASAAASEPPLSRRNASKAKTSK